MSTELNSGRVTQLLNQGTMQLDQQTLSALSHARQEALKKQQVHAPVFALTTGQLAHNLLPHTAQQWLAALALAAVLAGSAGYWQHSQEQQISELDVAILTDELPIEVFVD